MKEIKEIKDRIESEYRKANNSPVINVLYDDVKYLIEKAEYWNTNFYIKEQLSLHLDKEIDLRKKYESFLKSVIRSGEPFDDSKTFKWFCKMEEIEINDVEG